MYIVNISSTDKSNLSFKSKLVPNEYLKSSIKYFIKKSNDYEYSLDTHRKSGFYAHLKTLINDGKNDTIRLSGDYNNVPLSNGSISPEDSFWGSTRYREEWKIASDYCCSEIAERLREYVYSKDELYKITKDIYKNEGLDSWIDRESVNLYVSNKLKEILKKLFPTEQI